MRESLSRLRPRILALVLALAFVVVPLEPPAVFASEPLGFQSGTVQMQAERIRMEADGAVLVAEGAVLVRDAEAELLADEVTLNRTTRTLQARGNIILQREDSRLQADSLSLTLADGRLVLVNARIWASVDGRVPSAPSGFVFFAERVERLDDTLWQADGCRFSPCRCADDSPPPLHLEAREALVKEGDAAALKAPVVHVHDLPVMALPSATVSLARRKAGLVPPDLSYTGRNGLELGEGYFVPLHDEADVTPGLRWFSKRGVEPHQRFRYNTGEAEGALSTSYLRDWSAEQGAPRPKDRFHLDGEHRWQLTPFLDQKLALDLSRDAHWSNDFGQSLNERADERRHSLLALEAGRRSLHASLWARWEQDPNRVSGANGDFWKPSEDLSLQQLPGASVNLMHHSLFDGALLQSLVLGASHFFQTGHAATTAPDGTSSFDNQVPETALPMPFEAKPTDMQAQDKSLRVTRLDWQYRLRAPWKPTAGLLLEPHADLVGKTFVTEDARSPSTSEAYAELGARANLSLFRVFRYESGSALLHRLVPEVEYRLLPWMSAPSQAGVPQAERLPVDALDARVHPHEIHARLRQEFSLRTGDYTTARTHRFLSLTLEQPLSLPHPDTPSKRLIEPMLGEARFHVLESHLSGTLATDWSELRVPHAQARLFLGRLAGLGLDAVYWYAAKGMLLSDWATERREPLEETRHNLEVGPSFEYDKRWSATYRINLDIEPATLHEQRFGLAYASSCDCFFARLDFALRPGMLMPDTFFHIGLGGF